MCETKLYREIKPPWDKKKKNSKHFVATNWIARKEKFGTFTKQDLEKVFGVICIREVLWILTTNFSRKK